MKLDIEAEIETLLLLKPETLLRGEQVRLEALTRLKRIGEIAQLPTGKFDDKSWGEILRLCGVEKP